MRKLATALVAALTLTAGAVAWAHTDNPADQWWDGRYWPDIGANGLEVQPISWDCIAYRGEQVILGIDLFARGTAGTDIGRDWHGHLDTDGGAAQGTTYGEIGEGFNHPIWQSFLLDRKPSSGSGMSLTLTIGGESRIWELPFYGSYEDDPYNLSEC